MKDPGEILVNKLLELGVGKFDASIIALDAGSSQCVVNKEYLTDMNINKGMVDKVYIKKNNIYCGELTTYNLMKECTTI